jgi:hypothetical protein
MKALKFLLELERPTSKAKAYNEWPILPNVVIEDNELQQIYDRVFSLSSQIK